MHQLVLFVNGSASDEAAEACHGLWRELAQQSWTHEPALFDQHDPVPVTRPGDLPVLRSVGFAVRLPDPSSESVESLARRDVERLIASASRLAATAGIDFVVEYDQDQVGYLDGGPGDGGFVREFFGS